MGFTLLDTEKPLRRSLKAKTGEAILPGMLLEIDTGEYAKHGVAGGNAQLRIADDHPGNKDLDTAYSDGDTVPALINPPAFRGWLADGETAVVGSPLESNGDGTLAVHTAADETTSIIKDRIVGYADEAASPSGANVRIKVIANR